MLSMMLDIILGGALVPRSGEGSGGQHTAQGPNDAPNRKVNIELEVDIANSDDTMHMIRTSAAGKRTNDCVSIHKHPCGEIHHDHG